MYAGFASGGKVSFQRFPETTASATLFGKAVDRLRASFAQKLNIENVKHYFTEAITSGDRTLLASVLKFIGKNAASAELANDPFLQFCETLKPENFLTLVRAIPDTILLGLLRQTLCAPREFRGLADVADELDALEFPDFPQVPASKATNYLVPAVFIQIEVQGRWFADMNFRTLYARTPGPDPERVGQNYAKTMVAVRALEHSCPR